MKNNNPAETQNLSHTVNIQNGGYSGLSVGISADPVSCSSQVYTFENWSTPERVEVNEYPDRIEMIYKQISMITYTVYPPLPPDTRVFKIIYSCVDGKWHKSEPIIGTIVHKRDESYEFKD